MKLNADKWFTEVYPDDGCALSLEFSEKLHEEKTGWQKLEVYQTTGFGRLMLLRLHHANRQGQLHLP
jgi:spermidine synthase